MKYDEPFEIPHPNHSLRFQHLQDRPFKCDGCLEPGIGACYKCDGCDFHYHAQCALPLPSIFHPLYPKCAFEFLTRPLGRKPRYCNACNRDVRGYVYHCRSCGYDLHPCCARLPASLEIHGTRLHLGWKVVGACHWCGKKGRRWSYRSACKKYNVHVACSREMMGGAWNVNEMCVRNGGVGIPLGEKHKGKKVKKIGCEIGAMVLQIVISAILGDPTALIGAVIASIISR